jgi:chromate transporter
LSAPLNAITAAVAGVIVSLAVFFAQHVFVPESIIKPDMLAIGITLFSLWMLVKWNLSIIKLVLVCAAIGLANYLIF